ncbi:MAG: helix-turn-helix domain-containing protein [Flavobacteriaceae bacterium]|nr:helix-turn-helix domain-containing protein [Flavobacteriaceae bacterium]
MGFSKDVLFIKKIGHQIKNFRKLQGMTQFDLAIKSEMEENALQRIETGRTNPTIKTLLKITEALDIELFELFVFKDVKKVE